MLQLTLWMDEVWLLQGVDGPAENVDPDLTLAWGCLPSWQVRPCCRTDAVCLGDREEHPPNASEL